MPPKSVSTRTKTDTARARSQTEPKRAPARKKAAGTETKRAKTGSKRAPPKDESAAIYPGYLLDLVSYLASVPSRTTTVKTKEQKQKAILDLAYPNGASLLRLEEKWRYLALEIGGMIYEMGFDETIAFLKDALREKMLASKLVFNAPNMKEQNDYLTQYLINFTRRIKIKQGIRACPKCGSNSTNTILVQTRSIDEPMTERSTCFNCGHRF